MKLNKTETKLMSRIDANGARNRAGYHGEREANAADKLEKKGIIKRHPSDGRYEYRNRVGDYLQGYCPQGWIERS